jgi:hypothetical protein
MNERVTELVYGELDGANSPEESAELSTLLDQDPGLKAFYEESSAFFGALDQVPDQEPPPELKGRIMAAVEREASMASAPRTGVAHRLSGWFQPLFARPALAMAYAFVAGLLVAVAAVSTLSVPDLTGSQTVQGTMGQAISKVLDQQTIQMEGVSVDLSTWGLGSEVVLEINITGEPANPLEVSVVDAASAETTIVARNEGRFTVQVGESESLLVVLKSNDQEESTRLIASTD